MCGIFYKYLLQSRCIPKNGVRKKNCSSVAPQTHPQTAHLSQPPAELICGFFREKNFLQLYYIFMRKFLQLCGMLSSESGRSADVGKKSVVGGQIREAGFGRSARRQSEDRDAERQPQDGKDGGRNDARTGENLQAPVLSAAEALIRFRSFFCLGQTSACKSAASRLQACRKSVAIPLRADVLKRGERSRENKAFAVHRSAFFAKIMRADATARRGGSVPRERVGAGVRRLGVRSARGGKGAAHTENKGDL